MLCPGSAENVAITSLSRHNYNLESALSAFTAEHHSAGSHQTPFRWYISIRGGVKAVCSKLCIDLYKLYYIRRIFIVVYKKLIGKKCDNLNILLEFFLAEETKLQKWYQSCFVIHRKKWIVFYYRLKLILLEVKTWAMLMVKIYATEANISLFFFHQLQYGEIIRWQ